MVGIGFAMERGLIKYFYKRPHADQILVTFGLAIVIQEIDYDLLRQETRLPILRSEDPYTAVVYGAGKALDL